MIKQTILNKFPEWYEDLTPDKYYLVLSNDFDSYYSCKLLKDKFKLKVGGYYEFNSGLWLNKERTEGKAPIYVDLSIVEGKTFDNHFTFINNPQAINPNINTTVYNRKFNGSTLALLYALYDKDLNKLNEIALTALLCIDGWYIGYYKDNGRWKDINIFWYEALGMKEILLPILEAHDNQYFINFAKQYKLNEPIHMSEDGYLYCAANPPLPECKFTLYLPVTKKYVSKYEAQTMYDKHKDDIFTGAETYYNQYSISRKVVF